LGLFLFSKLGVIVIKAVIFDLDGTLLNTIEDIRDSINQFLANNNFPTYSTESYYQFVGDGLADLLKRAIPNEYLNNEIINKGIEFFNQDYKTRWKKQTKPYNGIIELLEKLKDENYTIAVLSNKPDAFTQIMVNEIFGENYFSLVQGALDNFPLKPNPFLANQVLDKLKLKAEETIFVGDSDIDILTAKNYGAKSIGVAWGFRGSIELKKTGASYIVDNPHEILQIVKSDKLV
jgi:phosphoglycolate phosphatase